MYLTPREISELDQGIALLQEGEEKNTLHL